MLDNFALLSGQITTLNRLLKNDKTPPLRNYVFLPLVLAPERDPALEVRMAKPVLMTCARYPYLPAHNSFFWYLESV